MRFSCCVSGRAFILLLVLVRLLVVLIRLIQEKRCASSSLIANSLPVPSCTVLLFSEFLCKFHFGGVSLLALHSPDPSFALSFVGPVDNSSSRLFLLD